MGFGDLKKALHKIDQSIKSRNDQSQPAYNRKPIPLPQDAQNTKTDVPQLSKNDLFAEPISTNPVPNIYNRNCHAQPPVGCRCGKGDDPIHTNNFYNNLTLGDQTFPVWTLPYSLWLTKDPDQDAGLAFNHTEASQRVFGPDPGADPVQFYFNPPKIKSFVFTGEGFSESNLNLDLDNHSKMYVTANVASGSSSQYISFPLAQGMGFVTGIYVNMRPIIASQVGIQEFSKVGPVGPTTKYRVKLFNQVIWSMYVSGNSPVDFQLANGKLVGSSQAPQVVVQFCRGDSKAYDDTAGCYPDSCTISGRISSDHGDKCLYSFNYGTKGTSISGKTILWGLPHQQEVLIPEIKKAYAGIDLDSTTKGVMKAYVTNELVMEEQDLPVQINFEPWSTVSTFKGKAAYSDNVKEFIRGVARNEIEQDVVAMADIDSMYTSGKILDKFAYILYVCKFVLNDDALTRKLFDKLSQAIDIYASNRQKFPLVYDETWKGLVSSADPGADFGNSNYNDHHFHYGYHIHAIALVALVDQEVNAGKWLQADNQKVLNYALTLLRDVANPSTKDSAFPQFRSFDWYHGHSFAHGIFASGDGKDEESSSEDYHFAYGMKLFAKVVRDAAMENRANLMLAIMRRSMNMYMLFSDDNTVQPKRFIKNKVAGITFENKIDFATYFGRGTIANEWIHGIHMLPVTPISSYIRKEKFVREEWDEILEPIIEKIPDGWKGILMLNLALCDPKRAWRWFSRNDWQENLIDNGMSRTWSLAYIAGIGGAS